MPSRRGFITLVGGGVVLAAGAALGLTAFPVGLPNPAQAWINPGAGEDDIRRKALSYAILAPNPHNRQPWRADLREIGVITLSVDLDRLLPETDPFGRQILIGCGAFWGLLDMAARAFGFTAETVLFPEGEPAERLDQRPFARVTLKPSPVDVDPLFEHALARRTNRQPYDLSRTPRRDDLTAIAAAGAQGALIRAAFTTDADKVAALRSMVWRGWQREASTPAAIKESVDLMRIGDAAIAQHRNGISMGGPLMNVLSATGAITEAALLDPSSDASKQGAAIWKAMADTAPAFLWQASADNARTTQIAVGRAYLRMNLEATARGLSIHPWSMALQEYPAIADLFAEQQAMLGGTAQAPVQMLVRIGYAGAVSPSPRRGLGALIADG